MNWSGVSFLELREGGKQYPSSRRRRIQSQEYGILDECIIHLTVRLQCFVIVKSNWLRLNGFQKLFDAGVNEVCARFIKKAIFWPCPDATVVDGEEGRICIAEIVGPQTYKINRKIEVIK